MTLHDTESHVPRKVYDAEKYSDEWEDVYTEARILGINEATAHDMATEYCDKLWRRADDGH